MKVFMKLILIRQRNLSNYKYICYGNNVIGVRISFGTYCRTQNVTRDNYFHFPITLIKACRVRLGISDTLSLISQTHMFQSATVLFCNNRH